MNASAAWTSIQVSESVNHSRHVATKVFDGATGTYTIAAKQGAVTQGNWAHTWGLVAGAAQMLTSYNPTTQFNVPLQSQVDAYVDGAGFHFEDFLELGMRFFRDPIDLTTGDLTVETEWTAADVSAVRNAVENSLALDQIYQQAMLTWIQSDLSVQQGMSNDVAELVAIGQDLFSEVGDIGIDVSNITPAIQALDQTTADMSDALQTGPVGTVAPAPLSGPALTPPEFVPPSGSLKGEIESTPRRTVADVEPDATNERPVLMEPIEFDWIPTGNTGPAPLLNFPINLSAVGGPTLNFAADMSWYDGELRALVHTAILAVVTIGAAGYLYEEFRRA